jgi:hypothetical protein
MALIFQVFQPVTNALCTSRVRLKSYFSLVQCTTDIRLLGGGRIDILSLSLLQVLHACRGLAVLPVDFPLQNGG